MHVFVETNWVVDVVAPAHHQQLSAVRLLERAASGELTLHVPLVSFTEARKVIHQGRFTSRQEVHALRHYVKWARDHDRISAEEAGTALMVVDRLHAQVRNEIGQVDDRLATVMGSPGVRAFSLSEPMLERSKELALRDPVLEPFDQAILAAILVRSAEVRSEFGLDRCYFCEKDHHLLPWDRNGDVKPTLAALYDEQRIWVYEDWEMSGGPWDGWPDEPVPA